MAPPPSPLVGFNNNVKHRGRTFHVQTEDSGVARPHVVTNLFADGGRIVSSTRTDYAEHLGRADLAAVVRRLMNEQHKAMFIALRDGQLDEAVERTCGPWAEPPPPPRAGAPVPEAPAPAAEALAPLSPQAAPRAGGSLADLVLPDLGRAHLRAPAAQDRPASRAGTPLLGTPVTPRTARTPSGRYSAPRPAAIFASTAARDSLFGETPVTHQSLDEVILSYLADDLEGDPRR